MPHLSVSLLGPIKVALDGQAITRFESNKVKALLAYLATEADQPHHRSVLSGLLWPDRPDRAARNNLRNALSLLRRFIGDHRATPPFLQIVGETIQFNCTSHCWLDVKAFTDLLEADPAVCPQLEGAIALYRGDFLEGFSLKDSPPFEDWALLVRERLRRQALTALSHLAEHHEARCDYERARSYAWRQVALEPWQEEAHRHLMRLLALNGQRSVALAQYETCCRLLREELGVEPAPETTRLYERIRGGLETPVAPSSPSHNLPAQLIPLVGREAELAEIAALLRDPACRLLTLVGPGGSGKTRLAIEAARGQLDRFPHGVCLCSLALLHSPEAIVPTLAQALGLSFRREGDPRQQLLDYLREKRLLLLLDNFEHLLAPPETGQEDGVQFLTEILEMAPGVEILATSRARLNARGEALYPVGGMDFPADGMDFPADGMDLPEPASLDARDTERLE